MLHSSPCIRAVAAAVVIFCLILALITIFPPLSRPTTVHRILLSSRTLWWRPPFPGIYPKSDMFAAFLALQAWKKLITHDPNNITTTWVGPYVCSYHGVFCAPPPDLSHRFVVAGIDLNGQNISGTLPDELGHLCYLSLFHINSNNFAGTLPSSLSSWTYLFELDISNNMFSGSFPTVVLSLPSLAYLDIRFNRFSGELPEKLFTKPLDAIFINNNYFSGPIPFAMQNSPASVIVLAHNNLKGEIPTSLNVLSSTLNELVLLGNTLEACIPPQLGQLTQLTVLDLSHNNLIGTLPSSFGSLMSLEQLNVANNLLCGTIPTQICALPNLQNFTTSFNFFIDEGTDCPNSAASTFKKVVFNDSYNCIIRRSLQREKEDCMAFLEGRDRMCSLEAPSLLLPPTPPPSSPPLLLPPPPSPYYYLSPPPHAYTYPSPPPPLMFSFPPIPPIHLPSMISSHQP